MKGFLGRRLVSISLSVSLALTLFGVQEKDVSAASKRIKNVSVRIGTKNVTKKTYRMVKGSKKQLKVSVKPSSVKKSVAYRSGNRKIVKVSNKGRLNAKKVGVAKITIKVNGKKGSSN